MKGWSNEALSSGAGKFGKPLLESWSRLLNEKKILCFNERFSSMRTVQVVSRIGSTDVSEKLLIKLELVGSGINARMFCATVLLTGTWLFGNGARQVWPLELMRWEGSNS